MGDSCLMVTQTKTYSPGIILVCLSLCDHHLTIMWWMYNLLGRYLNKVWSLISTWHLHIFPIARKNKTKTNIKSSAYKEARKDGLTEKDVRAWVWHHQCPQHLSFVHVHKGKWVNEELCHLAFQFPQHGSFICIWAISCYNIKTLTENTIQHRKQRMTCTILYITYVCLLQYLICVNKLHNINVHFKK